MLELVFIHDPFHLPSYFSGQETNFTAHFTLVPSTFKTTLAHIRGALPCHLPHMPPSEPASHIVWAVFLPFLCSELHCLPSPTKVKTR